MPTTPVLPEIGHESVGDGGIDALATAIVLGAVAVRPLASVTCGVKGYEPPSVGVPLITPVDGLSAIPGGKLPERIE